MFGNKWRGRRCKEGSLYNYFKIHPLVKEEKSFTGYSVFSSSGYGAQWFEKFW